MSEFYKEGKELYLQVLEHVKKDMAQLWNDGVDSTNHVCELDIEILEQIVEKAIKYTHIETTQPSEALEIVTRCNNWSLIMPKDQKIVIRTLRQAEATERELDELKKKVLNLADGIASLRDKDMYNGVQFEISEELKRLCKGVDE